MQVSDFLIRLALLCHPWLQAVRVSHSQILLITDLVFAALSIPSSTGQWAWEAS